jgi:hypothetical protein
MRGRLLPRLPRAPPDDRNGAERDDPGSYIQGVSTRSVDDLVQARGVSGISKSQVSRLCAEIDETGHSFVDRTWKAPGPLAGSMPPMFQSPPGRADRSGCGHHRSALTMKGGSMLDKVALKYYARSI